MATRCTADIEIFSCDVFFKLGLIVCFRSARYYDTERTLRLFAVGRAGGQSLEIRVLG